MNIADNLEKSSFYFPDHTAVIEGDRRISYSTFNRDAALIGSGLVNSGIKPGDHVALCAPNSYEWLTFYYGILKAGAVVVTFSNHLKEEEFNRIVSDCQPKVIFTTEHRIKDLGDRGVHPYLELLVCNGGDISCGALMEKGVPDFLGLDRSRKDIAALVYTGGITGTAKGAMLSHENIQSALFMSAYYERSTMDDIVLCLMPLHHLFSQVHIMNATVFAGGGIVVQSGFDTEKALEAVALYQVTKFFGSSVAYYRLSGVNDIGEKMKSVRHCLAPASSMGQDLVREWKSRTGTDIQEVYGMTECASMVAFNHLCRPVPGSSGTPVSSVEVQIRNHEGEVLMTGKAGEICIRGPNVFNGYLNNYEETNASFWGDWFRSGDVGMLDDEGYLYVMDRLRDMILSDGEQVYPREIEEVLFNRPEVEECAVIGLPDKEFGEKITAFIVPKRGSEIDPDLLREYLVNRLPEFKVPREFVGVNELPKTRSGKLMKRELKRQYVPEMPGKIPA